MGAHSEKSAATSLEESAHQEPPLLDLFGSSNFQNCKKVHICCLSPRVCGISSSHPHFNGSPRRQRIPHVLIS